MEITASAVSLNVEDVAASRAFLVQHFDFHEEMAADGFASLARSDAGMNVVFLRRGLESLPDDQRDDHARGLILAFVVRRQHDLPRALAVVGLLLGIVGLAGAVFPAAGLATVVLAAAWSVGFAMVLIRESNSPVVPPRLELDYKHLSPARPLT